VRTVTFGQALIVAVGGGLTVTAVVSGVKWLSHEGSRERVREGVRQAVCSHEWEPTPDWLISPDLEWCVKCNARR